MSWKLAELRWRQDVGLNERGWGRDSEARQNEEMHGTKSNGIEHRRRGRAHTAPWCHVVVGKGLSGHPINTTLPPDPMPLAWSPGPSDSSTAPLLRWTQSGTNNLAGHDCPSSPSGQDVKESELSLTHLQTPPQPISFPCKTIPCPQFDSAQGTCLPQHDGSPSSKVSTPSLASGNKSRDDLMTQHLTTPQRLLSNGFKSNSDSRSVFDFDFARTPSFGLHFCQQEQLSDERQNENRLRSEHSSVWAQSQSFSLRLRRTSSESIDHSDSALLQNISMDMPTCYSSPDRRATRPLYPDLPSAYAQIQGRRAVSLQPASSTRSGTRFPLSPSSSSSEEDAFEPLSLSEDAIALRNIPCRKVHSAHGIFHELDYYPESSAVFETFDENGDSKLRDSRASATLEDIVSQYADASPSSAASNNDRHDLGKLRAPQKSVLELVQESTADADPVGAQLTRSNNIDSKHELYHLYHQSEDAPLPKIDSLGAFDEDEGWETVPESSRSGFLTPSKLRFRLRNRETIDTSTSSLAGRRSPASPWDPLSNFTQSKQSKPRPQIHHQGHLNYPQHQPSPGQRRRRDRLVESKGLSTRQLQSRTKRNQTRETEGQQYLSNSARAVIIGPFHPLKLSSRPQNRSALTRIISQSPPGDSSSLSTSHALPSSSLIPRVLDNVFVSSSLSPTAMDTSNETPQATAHNPTHGISSLEIDTGNSGTERDECAVPNDISLGIQHTASNTEDAVGGHVEATGCTTTFENLTPRLNSSLDVRNNTGNTHNAGQTQEAMLARHFYEGGYTLANGDISRFLRDSRLLRHGLEIGQLPVNNNRLFGQQGFRATGSSLANFSSDSTPLNGLQSANTTTSGSNYSDDNNPTGITIQVSRRFMQFLTGTGTIGENNSEYSSLGSIHPSTNSTSRSLMLEELEQSFSTADPIILCDRCPSFPLTPAILGVLHLDNMGRTPFERMQIGDDGEWLEKAWCFKHERMEYSRAFLVGNEVAISADVRAIQRKAGALLLVFGVLTYLPGGWTLIHSVGKGSPLATTAMAEVTRLLVGGEEGVVCCVHPMDAAMARAIERAVLMLVVLAGVGWLVVACWAATTI